MLGSLFHGEKSTLLAKTLDAQMMRTRAIANNIANVNTPGYQRVEVSFESQMAEALSRGNLKARQTDEGHMQLRATNPADVFPKTYRPFDPTLKSGVNNVDIDHEMTKLAEAQLMYQFASRRFSGGFQKLNAAVKAQSLPLGGQ